ncbi:metallophosphoesterase [Bdellovibrio svalbardensis]|uniref:Metallophosphoesterase n=1 Tax=Bdellovibrio svalbardensis TaxID=2972972 RepID=A0ABT6DFE2_9BACT|nr:metallophosphoesterase [Bdellovibrio svalbardensis]MDG0815561.1 metallophosphoesterase [Bdellovibrio svalbardensis]
MSIISLKALPAVLPISFLLIISACAHKPTTYVGLADEGTSFVKTVSSKGLDCEKVSIESTSRDFSVLDLKKTTFDEASICEATLPKDAAIVRSGSGEITIPKNPRRIVIMGDTGCRLKNQNGKGPIQKCEDEKEWPFSRLVRAVEKENADLIIHVGDYHYREACTDPVKCKPYEGTLGYGFKPWEADFLRPAEILLNQKPFIFVRGNHEDCKRAYEGFNKLLSPVGEQTCVEDQGTRYTSFGNFLIVNFDNATVDDKPLDSKSAAFKSLQDRYKKMIETLKARPETEVWLITHRPIWGLAPSWSGPGVAPVNINMEAVVRATPLPSKVKMVFAGHIHSFQIAQGNHPPELIIGESGTSLDIYDEATRKVIPPGYTVFPSDHGYALLERDASGKWIAAIKSFDGATDFVCKVSEIGIPCDTIK